jgi:hypothetical protein
VEDVTRKPGASNGFPSDHPQSLLFPLTKSQGLAHSQVLPAARNTQEMAVHWGIPPNDCGPDFVLVEAAPVCCIKKCKFKN